MCKQTSRETACRGTQQPTGAWRQRHARVCSHLTGRECTHRFGITKKDPLQVYRDIRRCQLVAPPVCACTSGDPGPLQADLQSKERGGRPGGGVWDSCPGERCSFCDH